MIWEIGIALILLGYLAAYWKQGITHPIPLLFGYWLVMLPAKYFLFRAMHIPFTGDVPQQIVDTGSLVIFVFLALVVLFHWFFSKTRTGFPLVEAKPRIGFVLPSLALVGAIVALAIATNGIGGLTNSLKLRAVAETGVGAYASLLLTFTMTAAIISLAERPNKWPLILFGIVLASYMMVMARTGMVILLATTYLSYLCMVKRVVPYRALGAGITILAPLALMQGILRQRGGYTMEAVRAASRFITPETAKLFLASAFGSRVNQLEAFSVFVDDLRKGIIKSDPLSPLYVFAQTVPRSAWPDKPEMFADQMTFYVSPNVHNEHVVFNFIGPAELMYAFGAIAGVLLTAALYGYLFKVIDTYYDFCRNRPGAYLFLAVTVLIFLGSGSQDGFFNGEAMLQLLVFGAMLAVFFRLKIYSAGHGESVSRAMISHTTQPAE